MFSFSFGEMAIVAVLALILIGPKQLPELARAIGRFLNDIKRTGEDLSGHFFEARDQVGREISQARKTLFETKQEVEGIKAHVEKEMGINQPSPAPIHSPDKSGVTESWKKLQLKSEITARIEQDRKGAADGE